MRSIWKGFYINIYNLNQLNNIVLNNVVNKTLSLYNGKKSFNILFKISMLYLKIGSFLFTRKIIVNHKKKEQKKRTKKKK